MGADVIPRKADRIDDPASGLRRASVPAGSPGVPA